MIGIYKVYEDGKLIREAKNKLTVLGRSNALSTMLGLTQSFAGSMGIGIDGAANSTGAFHDKTDLNFGVGKYPITASRLGIDDTSSKDALIYTARITDPSRYDIYELGLYSNQISGSVDVDSLTLFNFESGDALKEKIGTSPNDVDYYVDDTTTAYINSKKTTIMSDNVNYRIGANGFKLENGGTIFYNDIPTNLSSFYEYDYLKLAFYASGPITVTVKFLSGANFASYNFTSTNAGYSIVSKLKTQTSDGSVASVDWSAVDKIEISTSGGSNAITAVTPSSPSVGSATYTSVGHTFIAGDTVTITGSSVAGYNGTYTINSIYTDEITLVAPVSTTITMTNYIGNGTTTVTGTSANHGLVAGDKITISGATGTQQVKLNGTWEIVTAATNTFTFAVTTALTAGTLTTTLGTTSTVRSNRYTAGSHTLAIGDSVVITGSSVSGYNGTFTVTAVATDTFDVLNKTIGSTIWTNGLVRAPAKFNVTNATTGTPTWSSGLAKTSNIILDGLRISKDKPLDSIDGLVSRVTFDNSTKISKTAGSIIDIEYLLIFDLDAG